MLFFFNDTATTEIYTLSLHDALPISLRVAREPTRVRISSAAVPARNLRLLGLQRAPACGRRARDVTLLRGSGRHRSEEHTSELQSRQYLVCRLLLEKKH